MDENRRRATARSLKDIEKDREMIREQKKLLEDFMNKMGWAKT